MPYVAIGSRISNKIIEHIGTAKTSPGLPVFDDKVPLPWRDRLPELSIRDFLFPSVDTRLLIHILPDADKHFVSTLKQPFRH